MPPRIGFIAIALALGLFTTIVIAWASAAWVNPDAAWPGEFSYRQTADDRWEMISTRRRFGHTRIDCIRGNVPIAKVDDGSVQALWGDRVSFDQDGTWSRSECGWPMRALACLDTSEPTVWVPGEGTPTSVNFGMPQTIDGVALSPFTSGRWQEWRALPYRPLWSGLILNTLLFGAVWLLALTGVDRARRWRRLRNNRCPQCCYDLRGQREMRCPECGWRGTSASSPDSATGRHQ